MTQAPTEDERSEGDALTRLRAAIHIGSDQADRGEFSDLTLEQIKQRGREMLVGKRRGK